MSLGPVIVTRNHGKTSWLQITDCPADGKLNYRDHEFPEPIEEFFFRIRKY